MSYNHIFLLLSTFLLLQCSFGDQHQNTNSSTEKVDPTTHKTVDSTVEAAPTERIKLIQLLANELKVLAEPTLQSAKKLFSEVKIDVLDTNATDEAAIPIAAVYEDLVGEIESWESVKAEPGVYHILMISAFRRWLDLIKNMIVDNPKSPAIYVYDYVKKHGLDAFEKQFAENIEKFEDKVNTAIDKYWSALNTNEQEQYKSFHDWHTRFREAGDAALKFKFLANVFIVL